MIGLKELMLVFLDIQFLKLEITIPFCLNVSDSILVLVSFHLCIDLASFSIRFLCIIIRHVLCELISSQVYFSILGLELLN